MQTPAIVTTAPALRVGRELNLAELDIVGGGSGPSEAGPALGVAAGFLSGALALAFAAPAVPVYIVGALLLGSITASGIEIYDQAT